MDPVHAVVAKEAAGVLGKALKPLVDGASDAIRDRFLKWRNELSLLELGDRIGQVSKVKTLWNIEREVSLYDFYYPSTIQLGNAVNAYRINSLKNLEPQQNYVLQGTVGQGKSIFLRFLCAQELRVETSSGRIPIFIELRRVTDGSSFESVLFEGFSRLGLAINKDLFAYYARSGRVVLLLDAFDEIQPSEVPSVLDYLETLTYSYNKLQILVTSRPEAAVQRSSCFRLVKLAPLTPLHHLPFLERVCQDSEQARSLHSAITKSTVEIQQLLTTPLLMTLLVVLYKAQRVVPDTVPAFYEQLFDVLFFRHDHGKPGFTRYRYSDLDDGAVKKLFEAFCFHVRLEGQNVVTAEVFRKCSQRASEVTGVIVDAAAFRNEMIKTVCLMQEEGFDLTFIHKSVAEFHAAAFVRFSGDSFAENFYSALRSSERWRKWEQELRFLSQIDMVRYSRSFEIPNIREFEKNLRIDLNDQHVSFDQAAFGTMYSNTLESLDIRVRRAGEELTVTGWGYPSRTNHYEQSFIRSWLSILASMVEERISTDVDVKAQLSSFTTTFADSFDYRFSLQQMLTQPRLATLVSQAYSEAFGNAQQELKRAEAAVRREDDKVDLVKLLRA
jgi:hypothetical protein